MQEQNENPVPISVGANSLLDQMPFLKADPNTSGDHPDNAKRAVVRGVMLPLACFLLECAVDTRAMQTPEELVAAIVAHPDVNLGVEKQQALLSEFGPGEHRDWRMIGFALTMQGQHPLQQLSLLITDKLSPSTRNELTKVELASD